MKRNAFLGTGAATLAATLPRGGVGAQPIAPRGGSALVLTGGASRGAYQAGVIIGLAERLGLRDGDPLDYELVAGTSIGALNGFFVATAQYSKLRSLWLEIPSRRIFRLKPEYDKIPVTSSGVGTRVAQAFALAFSLLDNVRGAMDQSVLVELLNEVIDLTIPIQIPLYWTATNLTLGTGEVFYAPATTAGGKPRQARVDELLASRHRVQRPPRLAEPAILRAALLASTTIPIGFDPVSIPTAEVPPRIEEFVDGGIVNNAAIGIAQRVATLVQVIGADPLAQPGDQVYRNGLDLAIGCFEIMQRSVSLYATTLAYAESVIVSDDPSAAKKSGFADDSLPLRIEYIFPESQLPGEMTDFDDAVAIQKMLDIGYHDGAEKGWQFFRPSLFLNQL